MYEVVIQGRLYTVYTDGEGSPAKVSGFDEKNKIRVELSFSGDDCMDCRKEVEDILKGLYIKRVIGQRV